MKNKSEKASKKDLFEKLWGARDFEINHQWQRSVFLATFIVLLFTLYFSTLSTIIDIRSTTIETTFKNELSIKESPENTAGIEKSYANKNTKLSSNTISIGILSIIAGTGYSFSILWICMARGSKYMYERLEKGINESYNRDFFDKDTEIDFIKEEIENLLHDGDYTFIPRHGHQPSSDYDYKIFSLAGEKFSSSKINILIGHIFAVVWAILIISNFFIFNSKNEIKWCCIALTVLALFIIAYVISYRVRTNGYLNLWAYFTFTIRSSIKSIFVGNRPEYLQLSFVQIFMQEIEDKNESEIHNHVKENFRKYVHKSDIQLENFILSRLNWVENSNRMHTRRGLRKTARYILSNDRLKNLFETSLMYRTKFNESFKGKWIKQNTAISLKIEGSSISFPSLYSHRFLRIVKIKNKRKFTFREDIESDIIAKLYADTKWNLIRSNNKFEFNKDETSYKIILHSPGKGLIYIKLKLINEDGSDYIITESSEATKMETIFYIFDAKHNLIRRKKYILSKEEEKKKRKKRKKRIENIDKWFQEFIDAGL